MGRGSLEDTMVLSKFRLASSNRRSTQLKLLDWKLDILEVVSWIIFDYRPSIAETWIAIEILNRCQLFLETNIFPMVQYSIFTDLM